MCSRSVCCLSWVGGMRHLWGYWAQHLHWQTVGSDLAATQVLSLITHYRECSLSSNPYCSPVLSWSSVAGCTGELERVAAVWLKPFLVSKRLGFLQLGPLKRQVQAEQCPLLYPSAHRAGMSGELCVAEESQFSPLELDTASTVSCLAKSQSNLKWWTCEDGAKEDL